MLPIDAVDGEVVYTATLHKAQLLIASFLLVDTQTFCKVTVLLQNAPLLVN